MADSSRGIVSTPPPFMIQLKALASRKKYVDTVLDKLKPENLHLKTEIVGVSSVDAGVMLEEASGAQHIYDHVIMA